MSDLDFELRELVRDYFGIGDSEADTLWNIAKLCARRSGVPMAGAGAVAMAGAGAVALPLVGLVPGYVAGALAGFASGTMMCVGVHRGLIVEPVKRILGSAGVSEQEFKANVRRIVVSAHGDSGRYPDT